MMLREEYESFSSNEEDIGCIPDLEMEINLHNNQPVQKKYTSIPRPLYPEEELCQVMTAWLSSLTAVHDMLKEERVDIPTLPRDELVAAQQEDPSIARVLQFIQIGRRPTYQERQQETAIARQLLHEWNKLFIAEDGILYRKTGCGDKMVLPKKYHKKDNCQIVPELDEHDTYPCQVDGPGSEGEAEDTEQPSGAFDDEAVDGVPLRQSQRLSRPPLRMTYDAMGQPSFQPSSTTGIRGITASYPHQLWQPVPVSWMVQQPVFQPFSYFVPFPVHVQPMY
ncbi:unnamed protein product, partial [Porites lobata]